MKDSGDAKAKNSQGKGHPRPDAVARNRGSRMRRISSWTAAGRTAQPRGGLRPDRARNLRIVPVFGEGALDLPLRIGQLNVTADDAP